MISSRTCDACGAALTLPTDPTVQTFVCAYCQKQYRVEDFTSPELLAARELRDDLGREISDQARAQRRLVLGVLGVTLLLAAVVITVILARSGAAPPTASLLPAPPQSVAAPAATPSPSAIAPTSVPSIAKLELTFGGKGPGPGKFDRSHNLAVDRDGNVYVIDRTNRVQKFDGTGSLLATFQVETKNQPVGPLSDDIAYAIGVAVDSKRRLYVAIGYDIVVLDARDGKVLRKFAGATNKTCYRQLALDQSDNIYARSACSDSNQNALVKLSPGGAMLSRFAEPPSYEHATSGKLAVDASGKIYAPHGYESEVQVLTPKGEVFTRLGRQGAGECEFSGPWLDPSVIDGRGRIFVRDGSQVHVFDPNGKCLGRFDTTDSGGAIDLAIGPDDALFALTGRELVAKYSIR